MTMDVSLNGSDQRGRLTVAGGTGTSVDSVAHGRIKVDGGSAGNAAVIANSDASQANVIARSIATQTAVVKAQSYSSALNDNAMDEGVYIWQNGSNGGLNASISTMQISASGAGAGAPALGTNDIQLLSTGVVKIANLKTTGSAGSKKVVCVDTATGQLYASSSDTQCAN
jgi:hypothetical protein